MEVRAGDRESDRESEFPQQIAPFPETADLPTGLESENVPPQKLRPIRRSPAEDLPSFLSKQTCGVTRQSGEYFDGTAKNVGSGIGEESLGCKSVWCDMEDESSSSSDGDDEDMLTETKGHGNQRTQRKARENIESFVEGMVMKIMDKQEQMNRQLIEMIEKRERGRIIREEAWKQLEMERMKRDEGIRAQEIARSMALISFIQNVLGQHIEIPQALPVSCMEEGGTDSGNQH